MQQKSHKEKRDCLPALFLQNPRYSHQDHGSRQVARMQMLVGDVQRRSRHWQR